ncbi:hypothetical protein SISNIDRAFT_383265, partial [Sistotremastrum niveocremeum HHB9708]
VYLVAIIPGPSKPSKDQINRLLEPLVTELLVFWHSGVTIATARWRKGRLIRCVLIPLICDKVGAHEVGGFRSHSASLCCPYCYITQAELDKLDTNYPLRSSADHREAAELWRDAESEMERDLIEAELGVRWSELLRLPYWDPICFMVIDSMHLLLLGLIQTHCRNVWGMDDKTPDGDGTAPLPPD